MRRILTGSSDEMFISEDAVPAIRKILWEGAGLDTIHKVADGGLQRCIY